MQERTRRYFDEKFQVSYVMTHEKTGPWQLLTLPAYDIVPKGMVAFDQIRANTPRDLFVHFHGWDDGFERLWRMGSKDISLLCEFHGALPPDWSQFTDFDFGLNLWNLRRNRIIANVMIESGIDVLPAATWWDEASLEHSLDGLPRHSLIEVSNVNTREDPNSDRLFNLGLCRVRDMLDPIAIVLYGRRLKTPFDGHPILFYQNSHYTGNGCSYLNQEQLQLIKEA